MKAYVINQDQLKQYIAMSVIALIFSFSFGYVLGGMEQENNQAAAEKASESNKALDESESLTDKDAPADATQQTKKLADKPTVNKKSDTKKQTKKPEVKKSVAKKQPSKTKPESKKQAVKKVATKKPEAKKKVSKKVVEAKKTVKPKEKAKTVNTAKSNTTKSPAPKTVSKNSSTVSSKSKSEPIKTDLASTPSKQTEQKNALDENKRLYSIQAGMFASKNNAESFIEKLAEENFVAYVTDFVSTSGAVKYNVRVGHFDERDKARERLKEYQKFFSTPAYVVISQ